MTLGGFHADVFELFTAHSTRIEQFGRRTPHAYGRGARREGHDTSKKQKKAAWKHRTGATEGEQNVRSVTIILLACVHVETRSV